jgi:hypothetical protein
VQGTHKQRTNRLKNIDVPEMEAGRTEDSNHIYVAENAQTKFVRRHITSAYGGPCERISELADYFLPPVVENQKRKNQYLRDSHELLNILKTLKLSPNVLFVSMDIVSMYTNIPI